MEPRPYNKRNSVPQFRSTLFFYFVGDGLDRPAGFVHCVVVTLPAQQEPLRCWLADIAVVFS